MKPLKTDGVQLQTVQTALFLYLNLINVAVNKKKRVGVGGHNCQAIASCSSVNSRSKCKCIGKLVTENRPWVACHCKIHEFMTRAK